MAGFDLSTGSINLIQQAGDIPLGGGTDDADCNHECPKCCPPEESDEPSRPWTLIDSVMMALCAGAIAFILISIYIVAG